MTPPSYDKCIQMSGNTRRDPIIPPHRNPHIAPPHIAAIDTPVDDDFPFEDTADILDHDHDHDPMSQDDDEYTTPIVGMAANDYTTIDNMSDPSDLASLTT